MIPAWWPIWRSDSPPGAQPVAERVAAGELFDEMNPYARFPPLFIQGQRDPAKTVQVAAAVTNQHDVREAVHAEAACCVFHDLHENVLRQCDGAGKLHVPGRRVHRSFRHVGHHRGHQRIAQPRGDAAGGVLDDHVVLAEHHVRPVLLRAAGGHDDRGVAIRQGIAHLDPGELLQVYRRRLRGRPTEPARQAQGEDQARHNERPSK